VSKAPRRIEIDGSCWRTKEDFYEALAESLGCFDGHGLNADAFLETMVYLTNLNREQPPYRLVVTKAPRPLVQFLCDFSSWVVEARQDRIDDPDWGDDVDVEVIIERT
jgi:Barstar (barnase inhibitor)